MSLHTFINLFLKKYSIPTVIGYIITGVIISNLLNVETINNHTLVEIAEFGIVFLMFTIGLEFSVKHLMSMKKEVFGYGFGQVFLTGSIFTLLLNYSFFPDIKEAVIIGFSLSLSSTAIVLKILNENGDINTKYGLSSFGILLFQDIAVIPILLMVTLFSNENQTLSSLLVSTFVNAAIVLAILLIVGKYIINYLLAQIVKSDSHEIFIAFILLVVIGSSYLAHLFGFSYSLGAFIAGMMIAETKFKYQVEADLIPFRDLLLGLFFITIGFQIDLKVVFEYIDKIMLVVAFIFIIKFLVIYLFMKVNLHKSTAFKTALVLSQAGEFSLAVFSLSTANGILDPKVNQLLIATVAITMIITPFILKNIHKIANLFFKEPLVETKIKDVKIKEHIIICGFGKFGQKVAAYYKKHDIKYVIIEHEINIVQSAKANGEPIYFGNAAQRVILESVGIKNAAAVVVTVRNKDKLRLICESVISLKKDVNLIVSVVDMYHKMMLEDLHINHIVVESQKIAEAIIEESMKCDIRR
jgi:CPA2 family monovalent cation:H+ antiporter-2